jgi:nucleoside-diphosphate-sugar epimerase
MTESVLVTGGAGYIGTLLVPMLLERGCKVTIFDSLQFGAQPLLSFLSHPNVEVVIGDIRDRKALEPVVPKHDWVFHLAAIVGFPACAADPIRASTVNVDGTANVLAFMRKDQKLIFASTGSTYGKVYGTASEETPPAPLTLYGRTKRDAEKLIQDTDFRHTIMRFATVFGASPRVRLDLLVNDFVYQAVHQKQIVLFEGHFRRTFLHCADAAAVYPFAMDHFDAMDGEVYNVGDESVNFTKRQVALMIKEYVKYYLHEADVGTDPDQRDYEVDYAKIKKLGYQAKVSMEDGIKELVKVLTVLKVTNPYRNA